MSEHFTESELARAEGVLNIQFGNRMNRTHELNYKGWLIETVQKIAEALVADREDEG